MATKKTTKKTPVAKTSDKPAKKAPATKKATTKKAPAPAKVAEYGIDRSRDVAWSPKKVAVFKAMKALRATSPTSARSAKDIADKATSSNLEISAQNVRHYGYHAKAAGLTNVSEVEGIHGYAFYLTAAGCKVNPDAELKAKNKS